MTIGNITAQRLRELLSYNPETGLFTWRKRSARGSHIEIGSVAGNLNPKGYVQIKVDRVLYKAHRLAWLYMTGEWPSANVDHEDLTKSNNAWSNLRLADNSQNGANRRACKSNRTGFKGVTPKANGRYRAQITKNGVTIYLGEYNSPEQASMAYIKAAISVHGKFARAQ